MSKIYMVIADNGQTYEDYSHWNVAAFASEEAAQEFIKTFPEEIRAAEARMKELRELFNVRELTPEEDEEYRRVDDLAYEYCHFFDDGRFYVKEYELHE